MSKLMNSPAARDAAHHLHAFTNLRSHSEQGGLVIDRGQGIFVYDESGKDYIEGLSGLWCTSLGYSEPRLVEAAIRQLKRLPFNHTFRGRTHEVSIELAERLIRMAPTPMSKVFFATSGSEANDSAMKLIWFYNNARGKPEKRKILGRINGYHGTTIATTSLTGLPEMHKLCNLPIADVLHADCPHYYRYAAPGESEEAYADRLAANLEAQILREGPETVAAFFAEPVMGVGAVLVPPHSYFPKMQSVLRKYDVLAVADEIICGFGRTGNWWGSQTFDFQPDILTCAKSLSSAYLPISALLISEPIYQGLVEVSDRVGVFGHGFTYSGHPVPAAVALEALKIYEERSIVDHVRRVSQRLLRGLMSLAHRPLIGEVRCVGLMAGLEIVSDKERKTPFGSELRVPAFIMQRAQAHGLFIRAVGSAIVMAPPLIITATEIDEMLRRFALALDDAEAHFGA